MQEPSGLVFGLLVALLVVAVAIVAFLLSERSQRSESEPTERPENDLDSDFVRLLSVGHSTSVVLGGDDEVLRATPSAYALGLVRTGRLVHPQLVQLVAEARREGGSREAQVLITRGPAAGSGRLTIHVHVVALSRGRVLVLAEDRTAELRLEAVRRDFVANVSHELKTPVGAIALLAETLSESADDPDAVRHFASRLATEATRLSGLVQDIIDLSRLQDSEVLLDSERVAVEDVVTEAIARCEVEAQSRDIAVVRAPARDLAVYGDRALLTTAVRNLLDNALRYSDGGTRVTIAPRVGGEGMVEVAVIDQGIGIDEELLPRVFERFYRIDPARSRATGGTGLGLSIVKHVAADHGGEVTVWSQPGRGSTFTLRLPAAEESEHAPALRPTVSEGKQ